MSDEYKELEAQIDRLQLYRQQMLNTAMERKDFEKLHLIASQMGMRSQESESGTWVATYVFQTPMTLCDTVYRIDIIARCYGSKRVDVRMNGKLVASNGPKRIYISKIVDPIIAKFYPRIDEAINRARLEAKRNELLSLKEELLWEDIDD